MSLVLEENLKCPWYRGSQALKDRLKSLERPQIPPLVSMLPMSPEE